MAGLYRRPGGGRNRRAGFCTNDPPAHRRPLLFVMPAKAGIGFGRMYAIEMRGGWLYVMTNRPRGILYTGVTASLTARVNQHRPGRGSAFCRRYRLDRLAFAERFDTIEEAIAREKQVKAWKRDWKIALIETVNPDWTDFSDATA